MKTVFEDRGKAEAMAASLLDLCRRSGADAADILFSRSVANELALRDGAPEESVSGVSRGIGIRTILSDGRQGISYGNRFDADSLKGLVEWSLHNCRYSEKEEDVLLYTGGTQGSTDACRLRTTDDKIFSLGAKDRMQFCQEMTETARQSDSRILSVRSASWCDGWGETLYVSSCGFSGWRKGTYAACSVVAVLQDGDNVEMGGFGQQERLLENLEPFAVAEKAVRRTAAVLGAKPVPTGRYDLLLDPETVAALIDEIGGLFCASSIHRGHSLLAGRLGTRIASPVLSLVDDATLPERMGSALFDAEGVPTCRTVLIEKGEAASYLYNLQYAQRDGVESTGNASRGMSTLPDIGTSNLILAPGDHSPESLMRSIEKGLWVSELLGLHTLDSISGDFSLGVKGRIIRSGIVEEAFSGVTIAGNLLDLLDNVVAIGNDFCFLGPSGVASVVVENVSVAGE